MSAEQLEREDGSEGEAHDVRRVEAERADERRQGVRVALQPVVVGRVEGPAAPRCIPGHQREAAGEPVELETPVAVVGHGAVQQHQGRPCAAPLIRDAALRKLDEVLGQAPSGAEAVTIQVEAGAQTPSGPANSASPSRRAASTSPWSAPRDRRPGAGSRRPAPAT